MMGKPTVQNFVYKINSGRLAKAKWNLVLPLDEARRNDEIVALASSQMLRWIDELRGLAGRDEEVLSLKRRAKFVKKQPNCVENKKKLRKIYERLDDLQIKDDYVIVVMERVAHFRRAEKGFKINGKKYVRLVATNGQVKVGAVTYISEDLSEEIRRRINNGRDMTVPLVPAKLEAYRALTCSSSTPVTMPRIAVVSDCVTHFREDTVFLDDPRDGAVEPFMEFREDAELELTESDGYGLITPSMAAKWSEELGLTYCPGGFNTRCSWTKGMVFVFDILRFADDVAHTRIIKDVWGDDVDLSEVDVLLTESQLKLWSSYSSCAEYVKNCKENHYDFAVTKYSPSPEEIDESRSTNYQFLAPFELSDEDIDELIQPSIDSIKNIISQNALSATLFLQGRNICGVEPERLSDDFAKGLMIDSRLQRDPYVMKRIHRLIKKRIKDLSIGVVEVHGNFTIIGGDPYSLMQHTFGLEVTGLLGPHEIYSSFWRERNVSDVICARAPMSTAENLVKMHVSDSAEAADWFSYIKCVTLMSSKSGECHSLNGADKQTCPPLW